MSSHPKGVIRYDRAKTATCGLCGDFEIITPEWRGISSTYYGVRWVCESCRQVYHGHPGQWVAACAGTRDTHAELHATVRVLGGRS